MSKNKEIRERAGRTNLIKEALKKTSGSSLKKAIAIISLDLGLSLKKTHEYIQLLQDAEYIKVNSADDTYEWTD